MTRDFQSLAWGAFDDDEDRKSAWLCDQRRKIHRLSESPIEAKMADAMLLEFATLNNRVPYFVAQSQEFERARGFHIAPQRLLGPHRVDFAVQYRARSIVAGIVVECDGHEFHEKTKEQAIRDKRRDRELMLIDWPVMRFTGSEIHSDPANCAEQVQHALTGMWMERWGPTNLPEDALEAW